MAYNLNSMSITQKMQENTSEKCYVEFVILEDGRIGSCTIHNKFDKELDDLIADLATHLNTWIPATHNGNPCKTRFVLPIKFSKGNIN